MLRATQRKSKPGLSRRSSKQIPYGVRAAARKLGCSAGHLSRVLRGERESVSLLNRYDQLKEAA